VVSHLSTCELVIAFMIAIDFQVTNKCVTLRLNVS